MTDPNHPPVPEQPEQHRNPEPSPAAHGSEVPDVTDQVNETFGPGGAEGRALLGAAEDLITQAHEARGGDGRVDGLGRTVTRLTDENGETLAYAYHGRFGFTYELTAAHDTWAEKEYARRRALPPDDPEYLPDFKNRPKPDDNE